MNAYYVNHISRSIVLTRNFAKATRDPDTEEYSILLKLRSENPGYEIIQRTIAKKTGKRKSTTTYAQMIQYISCVENSESYMARFNAMRAEAASKNGSYSRVLKWFRETFPNFYAMPEFNSDNEVIVTTADYPAKESITTNSVA